MQRTKIALLAGGMGTRMERLGHRRLKPLIPFGGSCHLIDFSLDNAQRSGATEVLLMAQYNERQLVSYLLEAWCTRPGFRIHFGLYDGVRQDDIEEVFATRRRPPEHGTADALIANAPYLFTSDCDAVMVLHADHVYRFDYRPMVDFHHASGAALTIGYQRIEREYVKLFGMVEFDEDGDLRRFVEKPAEPTSDTVFTAVCIFDPVILQRYLERLAGTDWQHDISRDVIPAMLAGGERIKGFAFPDYWEDIGTVARYYRANMRMLGQAPSMARAGLPLTIRPDLPRAYIQADGRLRDVLAAADLDTRASIEHSMVYPGARIAQDATVRNCIVMEGAVIGAGALVENAIVLAPDPGCAPGPLDLIRMEPQP